MTPLIGLAAVALFALAIRMLNVADIARAALLHSRGALAVLADPGKSDLEKEAAARGAGLTLLVQALKIAAGLCASAVAPAALVGVAAMSGLASPAGVAAALSSPWMLAAACGLSVPALIPRG